MKRCPECRRDYDDSLLYCLDDGASLVYGVTLDEPQTAIMPAGSGESAPEPQVSGTDSGDKNASTQTKSGRVSRHKTWLWVMAAVIIVTAVTAISFYRYGDRLTESQSVRQFDLAEPKEGAIYRSSAPALLISPDGTRLVATIRVSGGPQLYYRQVSDAVWQPIAGTDGGRDPFFSPDGKSLAFFARGELKKVPLAGGAVESVCTAPNARGGTWESNDSIIFTPGPDSPLSRVSIKGGEPAIISTLDTAAKERSHRWPDMLPNGQGLLFSVVYETGNPLDNADIAVLDLRTGKHKVLIKGGSFPRYSPTGHLIYATRRSLFAVPFDVAKLEVTGQPFALQQSVRTATGNGQAQYSFSKTGDLIFIQNESDEAPPGENDGLVWVSRNGEEKPVGVPRNRYSKPRLGAGGRILLFEVSTPERGIWTYDIERGILTRLIKSGVSLVPVPDPLGKLIAYAAVRDGTAGVMIANVDGSNERRLTSTKQYHYASSWSPDGKIVAVTAGTDRGFSEIWLVNIDSPESPSEFAAGNFNAAAARFSPDGKWIAYVSDESGRNEVYVRSSTGESSKVQVSVDGGVQPVWSPNGSEVFFRNEQQFLVSKLRFSTVVEVEKPTMLFSKAFTDYVGDPVDEMLADYDISPNGAQFLFARHSGGSNSPTIKLILNWFGSLKQAATQTR